MKLIARFAYLIILLNCGINSMKTPTIENCETALKKCTVRMTCGLALHDYRISCKQELYGRSNTSCSELCQLAVISLANTHEGYNYLNCDCADNTYCNLIRNRTKWCYPDEDSSKKLCRVSELYCKAHPTCVEAWNYYRHLCENAFYGKQCTNRCNNSLSILSRHKIGVNIRECSCDGNESYYSHDKCKTEQNNVNRLCFASNATFHSTISSGAHTITHSNAYPSTTSLIFYISIIFFIHLSYVLF